MNMHPAHLKRALIGLFCTIAAFALLLPVSARPNYALITLLHTNDTHGVVLPKDGKGGLARVATLVKQVRADMPNVLLLDAGDFTHGTPEEHLFGGKAIVSAMNAMGYSAANAGNHDFDLGTENLKSDVAVASFPVLAANARTATGGEWDGAKPYQVFELGEARIGVIGLTMTEASTPHWPGWMRDVVI